MMQTAHVRPCIHAHAMAHIPFDGSHSVRWHRVAGSASAAVVRGGKVDATDMRRTDMQVHCSDCNGTVLGLDGS